MKKVKSALFLVALSMPMLFAGSAMAEPSPAVTPVVLYVAPHIVHEDIQTVKMVVPVTTDAADLTGMKLRNIQNSINAAKQWHGDLRVKVVLYAKGVHLLVNPAPNVKTAIDALRKDGVEFAVCNNSLKEQNIDFHTLYGVTDSDIVPSGFLEVAWLQQHKGYVVNPAN